MRTSVPQSAEETSPGSAMSSCWTTSHVPDWDEFVRAQPGGHHEQSQAWGQVKRIQGWAPSVLRVTQGGELAGGAMILLKRIKNLATIGYLTRGPLCRDSRPDTALAVVDALEKQAHSRKLAYLVVIPPYFSEATSRCLLERGFQEKPIWLPPGNAVGPTLLMDLTRTEDELFAQCNQSTRYNIRRGLAAGFKLRRGGVGDLDAFRDLMWDLCKRRGTSPSPPQRDFFHKAWPLLEPGGHAAVFVLELDGKLVASAFCFISGNSFRVWKVGWSGEHPKLQPNHAMWWQMICWARSNGYRYFDFVQIIPEHAQAILKGEPLTGPYAGVTQFKVGFGGQVTIVPTLFKSYNPVLAFSLRAGGLKLLNTPFGRNCLRKLGSASD